MAGRMSHRKTPMQQATVVKARDWQGVVIGCIVICILGVAVRYPLLTKGGLTSDLSYFASWANAIREHGLTNVYHRGPDENRRGKYRRRNNPRLSRL